MSNRNNRYGKEKNPFLMVLYILAVIALLACIVYFVYFSRTQRQAYQETVSQLQAEEVQSVTELGLDAKTLDDLFADEEESESESESESETEKAPSEAGAVQGATGTVQGETFTAPGETGNVQGMDGIDYGINIVVLNGADGNGNAAYWVSELQAAGYQNVYTANYSKTAQNYTILYTADRNNATPLQAFFNQALIQVNKIEEGVTAMDGETLPADIDVWILVGENDA